jgi:hypothetical protein
MDSLLAGAQISEDGRSGTAVVAAYEGLVLHRGRP